MWKESHEQQQHESRHQPEDYGLYHQCVRSLRAHTRHDYRGNYLLHSSPGGGASLTIPLGWVYFSSTGKIPTVALKVTAILGTVVYVALLASNIDTLITDWGDLTTAFNVVIDGEGWPTRWRSRCLCVRCQW